MATGTMPALTTGGVRNFEFCHVDQSLEVFVDEQSVARAVYDWTPSERIAAAAPENLRKGPRGGGRDRTKVVEHVHGGDDSYASVIGIPAADRRSSPALRERILTILREPSDGAPIAGKRWPPRYAARRIAWHALDHAWEIEDRTEAV